MRALGAVLAGGRSRRFGEPKATVLLAGVPLAGWVARALSAHTDAVVLLSNSLEFGEDVGLEVVPDRPPSKGPLSGLAAALGEAVARRLDGVILVACDMPLVPAGLIGELLQRADEGSVVAPESAGPWGFEPLCAYYGTAILPDVVDRLERDEIVMGRLLESSDAVRIPLERVVTYGDPSESFLNVNIVDDLVRARDVLARRARPDASVLP